jgi:hypothetical protein
MNRLYTLRRLGSILATVVIGVVFAMVTSVNAAPLDKRIEVKDKAKIEKVEKVEDIEENEEMIEEDPMVLNQGLFFDNITLIFNANNNRATIVPIP